MKSRILDSNFKYTPAASTDLRKTFARVRKEMARAELEQQTKVKPLKERASRVWRNSQ